MIPKIIHYCWFGGNPLPNYAVKYIESWRKYFPDYEIKEWNENNYDVHKIPYTAEAYDAQKYAFVSDYARFDILYEYGGIYFDVDVEVIRSFGKILDDTGFMGCEQLGAVAAGLGVGCNAGLGVIKEILDHYAREHFLCNDMTKKYNNKTVVTRVTDILTPKGFDPKKCEIQRVADLTIYPPEYFAPENPNSYLQNITDKSVSIHHYWIGKEKDDIGWAVKDRMVLKDKYFRKRLFGLLGDNTFSLFVLKLYCIFNMIQNFFRRIFSNGIVVTLKYYCHKIAHIKKKGHCDQ